MDEEFQGKFIRSLTEVFSDILNGNIFEDDLFDNHLAVLTSIISSELTLSCNSPQIVIFVNEYLDIYFGDYSFAIGLLNLAKRFVTTAISNIKPFLMYNLMHIGSVLTFQLYYAGFSAGKLARIFFIGEE